MCQFWIKQAWFNTYWAIKSTNLSASTTAQSRDSLRTFSCRNLQIQVVVATLKAFKVNLMKVHFKGRTWIECRRGISCTRVPEHFSSGCFWYSMQMGVRRFRRIREGRTGASELTKSWWNSLGGRRGWAVPRLVEFIATRFESWQVQQ